MELPNDLRRFNPNDVWDMLANHPTIKGTGDFTDTHWEIFGALSKGYIVTTWDLSEPVTTFHKVLTEEGKKLLEDLAQSLGKK